MNVFWSLYTHAHMRIHTHTRNYTEMGGEPRGERRRGEERKSFPVSAAALLDTLTLTYISQSAFQGTLSASDGSNHISVKLEI